MIDPTQNEAFLNVEIGRAPLDEIYKSKPSQNGKFSLILKGKVLNIEMLQKRIANYGYDTINKTPQEIIANLLEWFVIYGDFSTKDALIRISTIIKGAFALAVYDENTPNKYYVFRRQMPLYIGQSETNVYVATNLEKLYLHVSNHIVFEENVLATVWDSGRIILQKTKFKK